MNRTHRVAGLLLATALLAGCHHKLKPLAPTPTPQDNGALERERARQDSIRRAQQARQDSLDRAAEAARRNAPPETSSKPAPAPDMRLVLQQPIYFDYDKSDLTDSARTTLDAKIAILREHTNLRLRINGHTDDRGSDEYNLALGMRRAAETKQYFTEHAVDASRFELQSFGAEQPVDPAETERAWAKNRRCEFEILER